MLTPRVDKQVNIWLPLTRTQHIWYVRIRRVGVALVFAPIGVLVTWALTSVFGAELWDVRSWAGLGGAYVLLILYLILRHYADVPEPYDPADEARRERIVAERETFLHTAVVSRCNPFGESPNKYPEPYRNMIEDMANIVGEIKAAIKVVSYSGESITINTGSYQVGSVKKELTERAARSHKRLILQTPGTQRGLNTEAIGSSVSAKSEHTT